MSTPDFELSATAAKKFFHASTDAIIVVDTQGRILFANPQAESMFGYGPEELIGRPVEVLVPEQGRVRHRRQREGYVSTPRARPLVSGLSLKGRRKDGSTFEAEIALTPIRTSAGPLVASTVRDVSTGHASNAYVRHLLDSAPDAMIIVDDEGRIAIANGPSEQLFGYSRSQMLGQPIEMLLPESVREKHVAHRQSYAADPRVRPMGAGSDLRGRRADGSEFPVEVSLSPVVSAGGSFVYSVIRDVTARREMETELVRAREAAERAHNANRAFLAAASHDLRQPVQALSLLNGALRRIVSEPLGKEIVESQQQSIEGMTSLLNSLLDISRLDAGVAKPQIEDFPIRRLVDSLSAEYTRQAQRHELAFSCSADDSVVRSDPSLLSEILQNLVSNAIRYTERGGVTLRCRSLGDRLCIDVRDTGIGIAEEHLEDIFKEFHRIRQADRRTEGVGLGLSIVRRLAELLGHEITVKSEPGKGSCFSVLVPIVGRTTAGASGSRVTGDMQTVTGGVLLLIEDDRKVAAAWSLLLRTERYQVLAAESADQAVALVREAEQAPEMIISDFHLACGTNGVDAVRRVREVLDKAIPAVIVSGDTSRVVDEARQLPDCELLSKPLDAEDLLDHVRTAITMARGAGA